MTNELRSRVREEQIQISDDNDIVSNDITLHKAIIPLLVVSKIYGLFPIQNICANTGSKLV